MFYKILIALLLIIFPVFAFAAAPDSPVKNIQDILNILGRVLTWVATAFWICAAGFMFYAGFLFLTAAESPDRLEKARRQLLYSIIAIVVGLMAFGMPLFIGNILRLK